MHGSWRLTAVVVAVVVLVPWAALAADKSADTSGRALTVAATVGAETKVKINTATVKELMTLEGVDHTVAERIVAYREAHGPFKKADDVRKVDGVGPGLWDRNRERIVAK
jgi:competence protein ComEA